MAMFVTEWSIIIFAAVRLRLYVYFRFRNTIFLRELFFVRFDIGKVNETDGYAKKNETYYSWSVPKDVPLGSVTKYFRSRSLKVNGGQY